MRVCYVMNEQWTSSSWLGILLVSSTYVDSSTFQSLMVRCLKDRCILGSSILEYEISAREKGRVSKAKRLLRLTRYDSIPRFVSEPISVGREPESAFLFSRISTEKIVKRWDDTNLLGTCNAIFANVATIWTYQHSSMNRFRRGCCQQMHFDLQWRILRYTGKAVSLYEESTIHCTYR